MTAAFTTVFFVFGLGFAVQRFRPLGERALAQLSGLVVDILLPSYLFFTTATSPILESSSAAPVMIGLGIVVPLCNHGLATLALRPSRVAKGQRSAFRFSIVVANTAFLGIPICEALFGPVGAVYAVLYDFGTTLVTMSLGIWELNGGHLRDWRLLVVNPLIWSVLLGLAWAWTGWQFPTWLARPFSTLGGASLPLALLVGGAYVGNIQLSGFSGWRQLAGLTVTRMFVAPLVVGSALAVLGWRDLSMGVAVVESAMPVGLTAAILAKSCGADAEFAASAILWSTLTAMVSLPLVAILLA